MSKRVRKHGVSSLPVDVVIVTGGRWDFLKECLEALPDNVNTIVIDNASDPEERISNSSLFEGVTSKRLQQPLGFAAANNEGARMGSNPYILFLNDDCILKEGAIESILETLKDPLVGIVGAKLTFPLTSTHANRPAGKVQHVGLALNIRGEVIHPLVGWSADNPKTCITREVWGVTGACLMTKRQVFNQLRGFDTAFGAGCLTGDTLISTDSYGLVSFDWLNYAVGGKSVDTGVGIEVPTATSKEVASLFHRNGFSDVSRITTTGGYSICGTLNHKLLRMDLDGYMEWAQIQDIKIGDYIALRKNDESFGQYEVSDDDAYLLGLYIAEGCCEYTDYKRVTITNSDIEVIDFLKKMGFSTNGIHHRKNGAKFFEHMVSIGVEPERKALNKVIPSTVMSWTKSCVRSFLQGLFDGDGCAIKDGRVTYSTSSPVLAKQLQILLLKFGCLTSISTKIGGKNLGYTIDFGGSSSEFYENIGFRIARKQERFSRVRKSFGEKLPFQRKIFMDLYEKPSKGKGGLGSLRNFKEFYADTITKSPHIFAFRVKKLLEYRKDYSETEEYKHLEYMVNNDLCWVKVVNNEYVGEAETFDLHVPGVHNYIANGFVSHNTYEDADLCLRVRSAGYKIVLNANAKGTHYAGATTEKKQTAFPIAFNGMTFKTKWLNSPLMSWGSPNPNDWVGEAGYW